MEEKAKAFIEAVIALSKGYGLSISHEDCHGGFIIEQYNENNANWLRGAEVEEKRDELYLRLVKKTKEITNGNSLSV